MCAPLSQAEEGGGGCAVPQSLGCGLGRLRATWSGGRGSTPDPVCPVEAWSFSALGEAWGGTRASRRKGECVFGDRTSGPSSRPNPTPRRAAREVPQGGGERRGLPRTHRLPDAKVGNSGPGVSGGDGAAGVGAVPFGEWMLGALECRP